MMRIIKIVGFDADYRLYYSLATLFSQSRLNILGQQLYERKTDFLGKGSFFLNLNFNEFTSTTVSSGVLFVAIESNNQKVIRKCVILKN